MSENASVGFTKDSGYHLSVQRTVNHPVSEVWKILISKRGMIVWLGTWKFDKWETGIEFITQEGTRGKIRVFKIFSHIRLTWRRKNWENDSILQIRTISVSGKTTISFHQEKLLSAQQREEMKLYWTQILEKLIEVLN